MLHWLFFFEFRFDFGNRFQMISELIACVKRFEPDYGGLAIKPGFSRQSMQ
jgi:hypothetical protein